MAVLSDGHDLRNKNGFRFWAPEQLFGIYGKGRGHCHRSLKKSTSIHSYEEPVKASRSIKVSHWDSVGLHVHLGVKR